MHAKGNFSDDDVNNISSKANHKVKLTAAPLAKQSKQY